jgi:hypothetical protein
MVSLNSLRAASNKEDTSFIMGYTISVVKILNFGKAELKRGPP